MITSAYSLLVGDNYIEDDVERGDVALINSGPNFNPAGTDLQIWSEPVDINAALSLKIGEKSEDYGALMIVNGRRTFLYYCHSRERVLALGTEFKGNIITRENVSSDGFYYLWTAPVQGNLARFEDIKKLLIELHTKPESEVLEILEAGAKSLDLDVPPDFAEMATVDATAE